MRMPDLLGHGGTGHDPRHDLHDEATADARALCAGHEPTHLIGHSFGATVALRLAVEDPGAVASLTLVEPVLFALLAETDPATFAVERQAAAETDAAMDAGDWARAADLFLARWGAGRGVADERSAAMRARMPLVAATQRATSRPATAAVRRNDLVRIACPVLLVGGTASPPVIAAILDALAAGLPMARRVEISGAGHMVPVTHPGPVSDAIAAFLATCDAKESIDLRHRR
jgi:pimeloyl-ACP methyl ester carboxylesterase